ncbi:MAG: helix-turn-helix domain-containing protein [Thermodesulfobacteriota bacterium]|jgi:excisionase family DNA binding protein
MEMQNDWLTVQEAVSYLKIARSTLYRWAREGRLTLYRLGEQTVRVRKKELDSIAQPVLPSDRSPGERGTPVTAHSAIWKLVGSAAGPADLAAKHDEYLAQIEERAKR